MTVAVDVAYWRPLAPTCGTTHQQKEAIAAPNQLLWGAGGPGGAGGRGIFSVQCVHCMSVSCLHELVVLIRFSRGPRHGHNPYPWARSLHPLAGQLGIGEGMNRNPAKHPSIPAPQHHVGSAVMFGCLGVWVVQSWTPGMLQVQLRRVDGCLFTVFQYACLAFTLKAWLMPGSLLYSIWRRRQCPLSL